nr:tetrahydromethanopterin S-methyltransferase subunit B [uncultured Methanobrevibacter sp.]
MVLPLIQFIPELNLNLDAESGILGAGGGDLIILSMDEINAEIAKVEAAADELMNSLDPNSAPLGSFPGREGNRNVPYHGSNAYINSYGGFIDG